VQVRSKKKRHLVGLRARFCCEYCWSQEDYSPDCFSLEHVYPIFLGGGNDEWNLAYSCLTCNGNKHIFTHAIDPLTNILVPLYHPRNDLWELHFKWSEDFLYVIGLTPTGRATIDKLKINRQSVVNLRILLTKFGKHPPN
jgi:HNH endonuclease